MITNLLPAVFGRLQLLSGGPDSVLVRDCPRCGTLVVVERGIARARGNANNYSIVDCKPIPLARGAYRKIRCPLLNIATFFCASRSSRDGACPSSLPVRLYIQLLSNQAETRQGRLVRLAQKPCHCCPTDVLRLSSVELTSATASDNQLRSRRGAILISAARQEAKPGGGDEGFKLIPQGTGEALIPDQDAGLHIAFLRPFREVGRCHEGDLVVNHDALDMKAGANRGIGR
jgi:hypothetical protein